MCLPIAITFSVTGTIALTYSMFVFWLLGGEWKERIAFICHSVLLWLVLPLILWSGMNIVRYETSLVESIRYWFGHYPYIMIVALAAILAKKKHQYTIMSSMNLGILLCFLWGMAYRWNIIPHEISGERVKPIILYRNTISFGVALSFWAGLWVCFPYTSRHISWIRHRLPDVLLRAMEQASQFSLLDFFRVRFSDFRSQPLTLLLALLRWSIVVGLMAFLFLGNPSRTAQLIIFCGYAVLLLTWNWKKGTLAILFVLLPFTLFLMSHSEVAKSKAHRTITHIRQVIEMLKNHSDYTQYIQKNRDRLGIWLAVADQALEKPVMGHGMEKGYLLVEKQTRRGKSKLNDPHNEFLLIFIQQGGVGLACFTVWMVTLFIVPFWYNKPWRNFGIFLAALVWIGCIPNTLFSYHRETYLICIAIAIMAAHAHSIAPDERLENSVSQNTA